MTFQDRTVKVLTDREHYAVKSGSCVVRQVYDDLTTTMQVRRVIPSGGTEELQIEIEIIKRGEKRNTISYGSIICSPQIADQIAAACTKLLKREAA